VLTPRVIGVKVNEKRKEKEKSIKSMTGMTTEAHITVGITTGTHITIGITTGTKGLTRRNIINGIKVTDQIISNIRNMVGYMNALNAIR
jgi:hypothetical protein